MTTTQVNSFTANACLISFNTGEALKRIQHDFRSLEAEDKMALARRIISELKQSIGIPHELCEMSNQQTIGESEDARPQKTRFCPPSGPRKRRRDYDGAVPLDYQAQEALAHFLSAPRSQREFKTLTAFAEHFGISRMTACRWQKDVDVLRRAVWLSKINGLTGDLIPRREWTGILAAMVALAKRGNTAAAKFCENRAWPEDQESGSQLSNMAIDKLLGLS